MHLVNSTNSGNTIVITDICLALRWLDNEFSVAPEKIITSIYNFDTKKLKPNTDLPNKDKIIKILSQPQKNKMWENFIRKINKPAMPAEYVMTILVCIKINIKVKWSGSITKLFCVLSRNGTYRNLKVWTENNTQEN